jgi:hypothetical protein
MAIAQPEKAERFVAGSTDLPVSADLENAALAALHP